MSIPRNATIIKKKGEYKLTIISFFRIHYLRGVELMEIFKIVITSLVSLAILFILTKLMGNRQVSELTMFDYVIGISIGSVAAEMATDLRKPVYGVVAMSVYTIMAIAISFVTARNMKLRRIFFGRTITIMQNGKIEKNALKKARLDISDFLVQARTAGYFDISDINFAVLEPNGKISFLPFAHKRPATPEDLSVVPESDSFCYNVITDGVILYENLRKIDLNEEWLFKNLKIYGKKQEDILLATVDCNKRLKIFPK